METPSFVTLFTRSHVEPLYFVQVTKKGVPESKFFDLYGHDMLPEWRFLEDTILNLFDLEISR